MFGGDPSQIAANLIAYIGSGAGGRIFLVALIISLIIGMFTQNFRQLGYVFFFGALLWGSSYIANTIMQFQV